MPVPKRKTSKSRRDSRSANKGIKPKAVAACQTCQAPVAPHVLCQECGYYKGVKVLATKTDRKYARVKQREEVAARVQAREASSTQGDNTGAAE
jgi:large subunit ribosomal protein L32